MYIAALVRVLDRLTLEGVVCVFTLGQACLVLFLSSAVQSAGLMLLGHLGLKA